jgi:hypothetical protein
MSYLSSLPKTLGELSVAFAERRGAGDARRQLGSLLCTVANCVTEIGNNIRYGKHSYSSCSELATYISNLHALLEREIDKGTADRLTIWLTHVADAPGIALFDVEREVNAETAPKWTAAGRYKQYAEIEEIAGTIRAFGNLLSV